MNNRDLDIAINTTKKRALCINMTPRYCNETRCEECPYNVCYNDLYELEQELPTLLEELKMLRLGVSYLTERAYKQGKEECGYNQAIKDFELAICDNIDKRYIIANKDTINQIANELISKGD